MINNLFRSNRISGSALRSNRQWMNIISNNIANAHTVDTGVRDASGNYTPYARQVPVFAKVLSERMLDNKVNEDVRDGVEVKGIAALKGKYRKVYDPGHPAARQEGSEDAGYVYYPEISVWQEMADLRMASASYEANLTVMAASSNMMEQALNIGSGRG